MECRNILFDGVSDYDCERMCDCFHSEIKEYSNNDVILSLDNDSHKIGIVLEGSANIVRYDNDGNRSILEHLEKNGLFGTVFDFNKNIAIGSEVISEKNTKIMFIPHEELMKRCAKACVCHSIVVENLLKIIAYKAVSLNERVEVLTQRSIRGKLFSYLTILQNQNKEKEFTEIKFSMTALSDYLSVNRSAMVRELNKMKEEGIVEINKKFFKLKTDTLI